MEHYRVAEQANSRMRRETDPSPAAARLITLPWSILYVRPPGFDGPASPHLILARPGAAERSGLREELADARSGHSPDRFAPASERVAILGSVAFFAHNRALRAFDADDGESMP